jgi:hypothetical protein
MQEQRTVSLQVERNTDGTARWTIIVDGKDHGGGFREPSIIAAIRAAENYMRDLTYLPAEASA